MIKRKKRGAKLIPDKRWEFGNNSGRKRDNIQ